MTEVDIRFDSGENWYSGFGTPPPGSNGLYGMVLHELGHALGLAHSDNSHSIMYYLLADYGTVELSPGDVQLVRKLYGAPEPLPAISAVPVTPPPGGAASLSGGGTPAEGWRGSAVIVDCPYADAHGLSLQMGCTGWVVGESVVSIPATDPHLAGLG
ncbi:MAG: matrixin family metalloprotease, partial [Rhodospirillales bacterium]|nr:matrixin family metalloprotease [Rhodospirillales bacterium]